MNCLYLSDQVEDCVSKSNKRRDKKKKARERRVRKNRESMSIRRQLKSMDALIKAHAPLPEFKLNCDKANADIKALVESGIDGFSKVYTRRMHPDAIDMMGEHTRVGWTAMVDDISSTADDMTREEVEESLSQLFDRELGNGILWHAKKNLVRRALPVSCFTIEPGEKHWDVRCRSLQSEKTSHGSLYCSPHRPTVEFDGDQHRVLFTRHAMKQLSERIVPKWNQFYIGQTYVFGFLYECVYFEPLVLSNGQPAFAILNSCLRVGNEVRKFMRSILGVKTDEELAGFYYRVGYCPITLDKGMAVAKTFLTPGYWQTPERKTLSKGGSDGHIRKLKLEIEQACDDGINTMSVSECDRTRNAVQWFHEHGVPQVKKIEAEVFRNVVGPYSFLKRYN
jgi:hypothetical protein